MCISSEAEVQVVHTQVRNEVVLMWQVQGGRGPPVLGPGQRAYVSRCSSLVQQVWQRHVSLPPVRGPEHPRHHHRCSPSTDSSSTGRQAAHVPGGVEEHGHTAGTHQGHRNGVVVVRALHHHRCSQRERCGIGTGHEEREPGV